MTTADDEWFPERFIPTTDLSQPQDLRYFSIHANLKQISLDGSTDQNYQALRRFVGAIADTLLTIPTTAPLSTIRAKYVGFRTSPNFTLEDLEAWVEWKRLCSALERRGRLLQELGAGQNMRVTVEIAKCEGITDEERERVAQAIPFLQLLKGE